MAADLIVRLAGAGTNSSHPSAPAFSKHPDLDVSTGFPINGRYTPAQRLGTLVSRSATGSVVTTVYTVIWHGKQGVVEKAPFDAEKDAREHAQATFAARQQDDEVVTVEIRKHDGTVVFSQADGSPSGVDGGR
ncbi:hypothetical protein [Mesorhizobium sp. ISC11]|uniref:hypothetical protein n=1 Tax=Mesorhizobium sp. ISC11 TaxID=3076428 RepID=UPI00301DA961